jgi:predicted unusual protein kinase regulating ubiquinone biosynthesis (AarF/ABC1/UbiB family)
MSLPTKRLVQGRRTLTLLGLPGWALADSVRGVVRRARGHDPEQVRRELRAEAAQRTKRILGELKGGPLKAGQLLSTVEMLFPQDPEQTWRDTLTGLQQDVPALPFDEVAPVLVRELGPDWPGLLPEFDTEAAAAASLGQVHRARTPAGREVAVKIQYPGVAAALAADVRTLSAVSVAVSRVAPRIALPPLVAEMRVRLLEELDYEHEAEAQRRFAAGYDAHPEVVVPDVVTARPQVLVTDWMDGTALADVAQQADQATRDRIGIRYQRFMLGAPAVVGLLHTDPHPGNFRLLDEGRLGVLDFGSTLEMPAGLPPTFGRLIAALQSADPGQVTTALRRAGLVAPEQQIETDKLMDYLAPFSEPAAHEHFHYTRAWLREQFGRVNDPRNPDFAVALQLTIPPDQLFTHRVWLGVVGVLSQLEARVPVRHELATLLPGFAEAC